ncbi:MAG: hypothetical protein ABSE63_18905 [Thermoguttaceae bacterium]|jgi:hypothetical protein
MNLFKRSWCCVFVFGIIASVTISVMAADKPSNDKATDDKVSNEKTSKDKLPPTRIEGDDEVKTSQVKLKVFIDKELLDKLGKAKQDLWLGVRPDAQSDTIWVQSGKVLDEEIKRTVNVGPEGTVKEGYTIVLFSVRAGSIKNDGAIKVETLKKDPDYKIHARKEVERIK